ncbi:MAG: hypothetical protein ACU0FH_16555 [Heliomarina sp.]
MIARVIEPEEIDEKVPEMIAGRTRGRDVVAFCGGRDWNGVLI